MGRAFMNGWVSLPTCGELYLEHGLPHRVWAADRAAVDAERLSREITELTGLRVSLSAWEAAEDDEGIEAELKVSPADLNLVLLRLAGRAAETFVDRYQKPIDRDDSDYDAEAYAEAMQEALGLCGLRWGQVDTDALRKAYSLTLHRTSEEIAAAEDELEDAEDDERH